MAPEPPATEPSVAPVETAGTAAAEAAASDATGDTPYGPDSARANEDGSGPEGFEIKGSPDSMKFHAPTSPTYDETKAEVWFRSAEAAEGAGFVNAQENAQENAQKSDDTAKD